MKHTVLFLCPHNAAKSVMASEYFNKRSEELGLNAHAFSAGTEPDEAAAPQVVALLDTEGFYGTVHKPRKVTGEDVEKASLVVSIGCDVQKLPLSETPLSSWDDVPMPSRDLAGAWQRIREHVNRLLTNLQTEK